jgi:hypothetical protein
VLAADEFPMPAGRGGMSISGSSEGAWTFGLRALLGAAVLVVLVRVLRRR